VLFPLTREGIKLLLTGDMDVFLLMFGDVDVNPSKDIEFGVMIGVLVD
jgi:hypothetical protein